MKQILKSGGDHRILVCAPSHTAANVITNRLATFLDTKQLLRLVSPDRPIETMSSVIKFCRQDTQTGRFMIPLDLLSFSVIVCTCLDAHLLYLAGLTNEQLRLRREAFAIGLRDSCAKCNLNIPTIGGLDTPHFRYVGTWLWYVYSLRLRLSKSLVHRRMRTSDRAGDVDSSVGCH